MGLEFTFTATGLDDIEARMTRGTQAGLDAVAKATEAYFGNTTATWNHKPDFVTSGSGDTRTVKTDDPRYTWINDGTPPHIISPKGRALAFAPGGVPKSAPNMIGAGGGSKGGTVIIRKIVRHPGIKARKFDVAIARKVEAEDAVPLMAGAIVEALL